MTTHAELLAAIDRARAVPAEHGSDWEGGIVQGRNAHLATLRAIVELHRESNGLCAGCYGLTDAKTHRVLCICVAWPCPTVAIVIDALRGMGVDL